MALSTLDNTLDLIVCDGIFSMFTKVEWRRNDI